MVRITEDLIRKRAEHNEKEIFSLEELSLHQLDVEKIEYLDKWCRELKILYLQSNLIPKIENLKRLKKLEYLNLALNNIEVIENLQGCESLKKLDLTVNFIGRLTTLETLSDLEHLRELFLTGNPCTEFDGYRDYVLSTLPRLKTLDGAEVTRSEVIRARQNRPFLMEKIRVQEEAWMRKRGKDKDEAEKRKKRREQLVKERGKELESDDPYWQEKVAYTPESRLETHEYMQEKRKREEEKKPKEPPRQRKLFAPDGRAYNINEAKLDYTMTDNVQENLLELKVNLPKYLDLSLIDCDVQPTYVRVTVKGKLLQLSFIEEVKPDASEATRSEATGNLYVRMPKAGEILRATEKKGKAQKKEKTKEATGDEPQLLEVDSEKAGVRLDEICREKPQVAPLRGPLTPGLLSSLTAGAKQKAAEAKMMPTTFVDDPDVPPLI